MVFPVRRLEDIASPERDVGMFDTVVDIPGRTLSAPHVSPESVPSGIASKRSMVAVRLYEVLPSAGRSLSVFGR